MRLLHPGHRFGLLALEMVVNNDLLLHVVEQLVADAVRLLDAVGNGRVARLELVNELHHTLEVLVLEYRLNNLLHVALGLMFLPLSQNRLTYHDALVKRENLVLERRNAKSLLEDFHLLQVVRVIVRLQVR